MIASDNFLGCPGGTPIPKLFFSTSSCIIPLMVIITGLPTAYASNSLLGETPYSNNLTSAREIRIASALESNSFLVHPLLKLFLLGDPEENKQL